MTNSKTAFTWTDLELKLLEYFNLRPSDTHARNQLEGEIWTALAQSWLEGVTTPEESDDDGNAEQEQAQDLVELINGQQRKKQASKKPRSPAPQPPQPSLMSSVFRRQLRSLPAGRALVELNGGRVTAALPELEQAYLEKSLYKHRRPVVVNERVQRYTFITPMFEDYMGRLSRGEPVNLQGYVANSIEFFLQELRDTVLTGELRTHELERELNHLHHQEHPDSTAIKEIQAKLRAHQDALTTGKFHRESRYVKYLALAELWLKILTHAQKWQVNDAESIRTDSTWQALRKELQAFQKGKASKNSDVADDERRTDLATTCLQRMAELEVAGSGPSAAEMEQAQQEVARCEYKLNGLKGLVRNENETLETDFAGDQADKSGHEHMDTLLHQATHSVNPLQRPPTPTPEAVLQHQQRMDKLLELIAALPEPQRRLAELMLLSDGDDLLSGNALAKALDVSPNNLLIKQRLAMLQALWEQLKRPG